MPGKPNVFSFTLDVTSEADPRGGGRVLAHIGMRFQSVAEAAQFLREFVGDDLQLTLDPAVLAPSAVPSDGPHTSAPNLVPEPPSPPAKAAPKGKAKDPPKPKVPPEVAQAKNFRAVMEWMIANGHKDAESIRAKCEEWRDGCLAISRLGGDLGERIERGLEVLAVQG